MTRYYSMEKVGKTLELYIFGDITSTPFFEGDVSEDTIVKQLRQSDVEQINVHISSYGGEVKTGIAIYNTLKAHKAKVKTICDGFACSIASVIFMAGDERVMNEVSMLMIHNAWNETWGNAEQLRKAADDLDKISQLVITAYKANSNLSEDEIKNLMDAETWISPDEALEYGFATAIEKAKSAKVSQSARMSLIGIIKKYQADTDTEDADEDEPTEDEKPAEDEPTTDEETDTETEEKPAESEENTDDEETEETEEEEPPETETEEETETDTDEDAVMKLCKFFNAIKKM